MRVFQFDLVAALFGGQGAAVSRLVEGLVGLSGLAVLLTNLTLRSNAWLGEYADRTLPTLSSADACQKRLGARALS